MIFSDRLRQAMNSIGMKQVELVEKTGISKSGISQYLSGEFEPKQENVALIAKALNVSPLWLMGIEEKDIEEESTISEFEEFFKNSKHNLKNLPIDKQKKIIRLIDLYLESE